jgi:hypothetical protein
MYHLDGQICIKSGVISPFFLQVNLCQKLLFLHQLNHNMTTDCSWNYHENYKCRTWAEYVLPMFCAFSFHGNSMNNLLSYCGLVDARISASEKDLPVSIIYKLCWQDEVLSISMVWRFFLITVKELHHKCR